MELSRIIFIICCYLAQCLNKCDTYLVYGIKTATRNARAGKDASRHHQLLLSTPVQTVILTVTANKVQLIKLIRAYLRDHADMFPQNGNTLVITGPDPTPVQICDGQLADRHDLHTTHEEADVVVIQQAVHLAPTGINSIRMVADDTDVFVLLLYYYTTQQLICNLVMTGTSYGRTSVDMKTTAEKHSDIIPFLLAARVLSDN